MEKEEIKAALAKEDALIYAWVGNIKKAFQKEQRRLLTEGVSIRSKVVWQSINETMELIKKRQKTHKK